MEDKIKKNYSLIIAIIIVIAIIGVSYLGVRIYANYLVKYYKEETDKLVPLAQAYVKSNEDYYGENIFSELDKNKKVTDGLVYVNEDLEVALAIIYDDAVCYIKYYNSDGYIDNIAPSYCKAFLKIHLAGYNKNDNSNEDDNNVIEDTNNNDNNINDDNNTTNNNEEVSFVTVYSNYVQINKTTSDAKAINADILQFRKNYEETIDSVKGDDSMTGYLSSLESLKTKYLIKNNVLIISMHYYLPMPSSGDGHHYETYFYNLKTDKELKIHQALPLLGHKVSELSRYNIISFEELGNLISQNLIFIDYTIENGTGIIKDIMDCREGCA